MDEIGPKIRLTTSNKLAVTSLQCILTPLLITVDMFALVVSYLFDVLFVINKYGCLRHQIAAIMILIHIRLYIRHVLS